MAALLARPVLDAAAALPPLGAWHHAAAGLPLDGFAPPLPWPQDALLRVADSSPDAAALRALPALLHRWPRARLLCLRAPALGFVAGRRRRCPERPFAEHCLAWNAAEAALAALAPRALVLEQAELDDAAALARRLGEVLDAPPAALPEPPPATPPLSLADMPWTLPEIELFAGLCGAAPEDLAAAARRRPLDLLAALRDGQGRAAGGLSLRWPPQGAGLQLRLPAAPCRLSVAMLWPGGRDRLSLFLAGATRPVELELLVAGSLTRRPLLACALRLEPGEDAEVAATLPAADELLDVTLSAAPAEGTGLELRQARLYRL